MWPRCSSPCFCTPPAWVRGEDAFEVLMGTLLNLGQETRREQVVQAVIAHSTDKNLATSARCRRVVMLTDRGDYAQAWTVFHEAQRLNPNDPQLWHLEMLTLLGEGRDEEARVRAPLLAARARKLGFPDLEHGLLDLGRKGLAAVAGLGAGLGADNEMLDDEEQSWVELLSSAPTTQDAAHCSSLYTVSGVGAHPRSGLVADAGPATAPTASGRQNPCEGEKSGYSARHRFRSAECDVEPG